MTSPNNNPQARHGHIDEETFHLAMEGADVAFWDHDLKKNEILRSPQWARMLGYEPEDIAGRRDAWLELVHPDDAAGVLELIKAHEAGTTQIFRVEHRLRAADGSYRTVLNWGRIVVRDADGTPERALGFHIDLTERERVERELSRLDKLESLGTLAGGIAHDFNNALTAIGGNINLARLELADHPALAHLQRADKALQQARDLTRQMLSFTRGGLPPVKVCDLSEVIAEAIGMALSGSRIRAQVDLPRELAMVEAADGQLVQLFHNLLINALHAMPRGGVVHIGACDVALAADQDPPLAAGRYVRVNVRDEGDGVPESERERIFDPFYTTKPDGTGLGLASVHSITRHQGGHVALAPTGPGGAEFVVHLAATDRAKSTQPKTPAPTSASAGAGRVLVMDDDPMVCEFITRAAEHLGYDVTATADGEAAIARFTDIRATGATVVAALLDLTVRGGMGGCEALGRLRELDPHLKAVVVSGYSDDPVMREYRQYGFDAALPKPFEIPELSRILSSLGTESAQVAE